ncbi:peptidase domain-containing ABC transporter [Mitsuaria sp. 7]|uniref:peptidase domain-containing ABC transporter n=1 Tax=Mitsuaria sp. 7 TaxID=1658665 RepID=UPI0008314C6B|nr:peptidase domain-containing ABC transporter [Mitsuaria sp. 7]
MSWLGHQLQNESAECGLSCLAIVSTLLGSEIALSDLRRQHPSSTRGTSLRTLSDIAPSLNLQARAVRCEPDELKDLRLPAVLHWRMNHFVVLRKVGRKGLIVVDPAVGETEISWRDCAESFTGAALELCPTPAFTRRRQASPLPLFSFVNPSREIVRALGYTLLFTVLLHLGSLLAPLFLQFSVDHALSQTGNDAYLTIALGFVGLCLLTTALEASRAILASRISLTLSWEMTLRLFRQMLRLGLPWFQRRRLADALSRFDSIGPIRQLVSGSLVTTLLDGVLVLLLVGALFFFCAPVALLAVAGLGITNAIKLACIPQSIRLGAQALQADIAERGFRIETIRAIQSIKAAGGETQREAAWSNRFAKTISASDRTERFRIVQTYVIVTLEGLLLIALTYLAVKESMHGRLTVGSLYACLSYYQQLNGKVSAIVAYVTSWRQTDLHSHRVAEIALSPSEHAAHQGARDIDGYAGGIDAVQLSFRYSASEGSVFDNLDLRVAPGEFIAITGPSGAGKSTLLKVLAGLYPPSGGQLLYDDNPQTSVTLESMRRTIGTVLQEDELLAGSIIENVSFFDECADQDRVWECLRMANIEDEVRRLPMQLSTDVGDMGSTFSAGQRQRLILARALYKRPRVLLLDEATAHLDFASESRIHAVLKEMKITRIAVAHRFEVLTLADRAFDLRQGRLSEMRVKRGTGTTPVPPPDAVGDGPPAAMTAAAALAGTP